MATLPDALAREVEEALTEIALTPIMGRDGRIDAERAYDLLAKKLRRLSRQVSRDDWAASPRDDARIARLARLRVAIAEILTSGRAS